MMETNVTLTNPPYTWSLCLFCGLSNLAEMLSFRYQINYCLFTHRITSVDGGTGWRNQLDRISMTSTRDIWSCQYSSLFFTLCSQTDRQNFFPSSTHPITQHPFPSLLSYFAQICSPFPPALLLHCDIILSWCMFVHTSVPSGSFSLFPISPPSHFIFFFVVFLSSCNFVYVVVHVRGDPLHHFLPFSCLVVAAIVTVTDSVKLCAAAFWLPFYLKIRTHNCTSACGCYTQRQTHGTKTPLDHHEPEEETDPLNKARISSR